MSPEQPEAVEYERIDAAVRDGIGEEDHPVPLWFNVGFYGMLVGSKVALAALVASGRGRLPLAWRERLSPLLGSTT